MNRRRIAVLALLAGAGACGIFEDPTPETISIQVTQDDGTPVMAIFSKVFVAGINRETDVTEVRVTSADTVMTTLPIDTIIDIRVERQLFLQVETMPGDTASVQFRVDLDARNVLNRQGLIFEELPLRYVYQFNRPLTDVVEVVF